LARLPAADADARRLLTSLQRLVDLPESLDILDVGAAAGLFVLAANRMGHRAVGVEPWDGARRVAAQLAQREGVDVPMLAGAAEELPVEPGRFDVVRAMSVIEHVRDPQAAFAEAFRALRPGGVFWFFAASSVCPRQGEISGFPLFGWYPDGLKRRIMLWARDHRPELVGHSKTPAMNWFTPAKARRMLRVAGFREVCDRWQLPRPVELGAAKRAVLAVVRSSPVTRLLADVLRPSCAYAAIK